MEAAQARGLRPLPDRHDRLASASRAAADALGLRDWTIAVDEEPPPPGYDAQAQVDIARHVIALRFRDDFEELDGDQRAYLLVHEILHAHLQVLAARVLGLRDEFGRTAWGVFWDGYEQDVERTVDRLATAVAPLLPPTVWGGEAP